MVGDPGIAIASEFEAECAPFQHALPTRAGTGCVGHMLCATNDSDPDDTFLSVDGIGAYDHVLRAAMLGRCDHDKGSWHLAFRVLGMMRVENAQSCRLKEASRASL